MLSPVRTDAIPRTKQKTPHDVAPRGDTWYLLPLRRTTFKEAGRNITMKNMNTLPTIKSKPSQKMFIA